MFTANQRVFVRNSITAGFRNQVMINADMLELAGEQVTIATVNQVGGANRYTIEEAPYTWPESAFVLDLADDVVEEAAEPENNPLAAQQFLELNTPVWEEGHFLRMKTNINPQDYEGGVTMGWHPNMGTLGGSIVKVVQKAVSQGRACVRVEAFTSGAASLEATVFDTRLFEDLRIPEDSPELEAYRTLTTTYDKKSLFRVNAANNCLGNNFETGKLHFIHVAPNYVVIARPSSAPINPYGRLVVKTTNEFAAMIADGRVSTVCVERNS